MKRSRINTIMAEADEMIRRFGFTLPPFAYWSPQDMRERAPGTRIAEARMGWDITDYGVGDFDSTGLFLFTLRNGDQSHLTRGTGMCYAEKLLISRQDQIAPMHTHHVKAEDIINRGGATLVVELFGSDEDGGFDGNAGVTVVCDGIARTVPAGHRLKLQPGESVTLMPGHWHAFWGEGGDVLIGEVSTVNDDVTDNIYREPIGRFSTIQEDEAPTHLLVSDYDTWLDNHGPASASV
ncbi:MAG: D-lyxose/D-mannose family sugar isomerase [Pseudomonadota bacterium]